MTAFSLDYASVNNSNIALGLSRTDEVTNKLEPHTLIVLRRTYGNIDR